MRTNIFILTFLFLTTLLFGQTDDRINVIRKIVEQTNNDTVYVKKTLDNEQWMEQMTDGGGQLTGFFKDGRLVKIIEWIGFSNSVFSYEYYLQNYSLIFVYGQEKVFKYNESTDTFDSNIQTVTMECRYYFDNDKLIKSEFSGQLEGNSTPSDADATHLLDICNQYSTLLIK